MKKDVGFTCYQTMTKDGPVPVKVLSDDHLMDSMIYALNPNQIYYRKPSPDTRSKYRKFVDDWKKRLSHAWYALKGYDCD